MKNLAKAIISVQEAVKGIDKSMQVGKGQFAYNGVPDQKVKQIIGEEMTKNGLCILPISVEPKTNISRWEEKDRSNNIKQKQSVFTEVNTKYLLLHDSGESIEISGYGQGVDPQDKSAGKATTYALKYALLYTFLVPTGKIDDTDNTHSNEIETPKKEVKKLPWYTGEENFKKAVEALKAGNMTIKELEKLKGSIPEDVKTKLMEAAC